MFFISLLKIISILLSIIGLVFWLPLGVAIYYGETQVYASFVIPMIISFLFMIIVNIFTRKHKFSLNTRQTFFVVAIAWISVSVMGALPLYTTGCYPSFVDAFFESVSGFTTTGATVLGALESLPNSINLWRCETHWLGGMGVVTLTVALMPLLGVGGFQLIKAETTGPEKGKVTARITTTAKVLWGIYTGFTIIQTVALCCAGMNFVEALEHSFATLGTGGFSPRNTSVGSYNSAAVDYICTLFMFLSGINFSLYYYVIIGKLSDVKNNSELKAYIALVLFFIVAVSFSLMSVYGDWWTSFRYSSFQVVSLMTTTGFATADYVTWPPMAQFWLFLVYFIGGCSGSTGGGIKVIRWVILGKQLHNETKKMLHPHGVFSIRLNGRVARKDVVPSVAAFVMLYLGLVLVTTFIGCCGSLDPWSAFTGSLSMVGNVGPAFGALGPTCNYGFLPDFVKIWYSFAMLAGRLELYTMMIYFMPAFWNRRR